MAKTKKFSFFLQTSGLTVYAVVIQLDTGYYLDDADGNFAAAPADPYQEVTESATLAGRYTYNESRYAWANGAYEILCYSQLGGSPNPLIDTPVASAKFDLYNDGLPLSEGLQTAVVGATRDTIVYGALRLVGAYASGAAPRPEQVVEAAEALDMMLKSWQNDGLLWLRQFIYVTLVADQVSYLIGPSSPDTVTTDAAGVTAFEQRPPRIYDATRYTITTADEVPITPISRRDYLSLPNKTSSGTPVQVYYDPQIVNGVLYVWPPASATGDMIKLSVDRLVADVGDGDNIIDIPPEWMECVKYNLALRISPEYSPGMDEVGVKMAIAMKEKMESEQTDAPASTFFQPSRY